MDKPDLLGNESPPPPVYEPYTIVRKEQIEVLNDVTPIKERKYETCCTACDARLRFGVTNVTKKIEMFVWEVLRIKCPICDERLDVTGLLEPWVRRHVRP